MMHRAVIYVATLGFLWGCHYPIIRIAGESGIAYVDITALVVLGDVLVFTMIAFIRNRYPRLNKRTMVYYLCCSVFGYLLPFILELFSAPLIGIGLLTIFVALTPMATVALAWLLGSDAITPGKVFGVLIGLLAILPLLSYQPLKLSYLVKVGFIAAALVPLSYAIYNNIIPKYWPKGLDSWQIAAGEALAACMIMLPAYLFFGSHDAQEILQPKIMILVGLYIFFTVFEIYLFFEIVRLSGAIFVSLANYVSLAAGISLGMIVFAERHTPWVVLTIILLLASIYLTSSRSQEASNTGSG